MAVGERRAGVGVGSLHRGGRLRKAGVVADASERLRDSFVSNMSLGIPSSLQDRRTSRCLRTLIRPVSWDMAEVRNRSWFAADVWWSAMRWIATASDFLTIGKFSQRLENVLEDWRWLKWMWCCPGESKQKKRLPSIGQLSLPKQPSAWPAESRPCFSARKWHVTLRQSRFPFRRSPFRGASVQPATCF